MATMLRLEKYGRIDFALRRWTPMVQKAPKSMRVHARESFKLARTFFRSLTWLQESLFWRWSCVYRRMYWFGTFGFVSQWNHICQHQHFPHLSLTTAALQGVVRQCMEDNSAKKRNFDPNLSLLLYFLSLLWILSCKLGSYDQGPKYCLSVITLFVDSP